jgi:hypothetical protein
MSQDARHSKESFMPSKVFGLLAACVLALSACCTVHPKPPTAASVAEVINRVKAELEVLDRTPTKLTQVAPPGSVCKDAQGNNVVVIVPDQAKLTLKTVGVKENDPQLGLVAPLGVLAIDPGYNGAYSVGQTQSLEIDFATKFKPRESEPGPPPDPNEHPLAAAIVAMAQGLLNADHTKAPCLKPTDFKTVLTFDVVNKTTVGGTVNLYVFKVGDKETFTNENHQTLEFDFKLSGSSQAFAAAAVTE